MKLHTLKPRLGLLKVGRRSIATKRTTGRQLQHRRLKVWSSNPYCVRCGRLTLFPAGFELDHIVPLYQGGEDVESNTQILCVDRDLAGNKIGCHIDKTADDSGSGFR